MGVWHSLDGANDLGPVAVQFNDVRGKEFVGVKGNEALILQNGILKTVNFSDSHINSIVCETSMEDSFNRVTCTTTFTDLEA